MIELVDFNENMLEAAGKRRRPHAAAVARKAQLLQQRLLWQRLPLKRRPRLNNLSHIINKRRERFPLMGRLLLFFQIISLT